MNPVYYKTTTEKFQFMLMRDEMSGPPPEDAKDTETASKTADLLVSQLVRGDRADAPKSRPAKPKMAPVDVSALKSETGAARRQALLQGMLDSATPVTARSTARLEMQKDPVAHLQREVAGQGVAQDEAETVTMREAAEPDMAEPRDIEAQIRAALREDDVLPSKEEPAATRKRPILVVAALCLVAAVCVLWPASLVIGLGAVAFFLLITPAILRRQVSGGWMARRWARFSARQPRRASRLHRLADRYATALDRVLDFVPAAIADRLAWPDLSPRTKAN